MEQSIESIRPPVAIPAPPAAAEPLEPAKSRIWLEDTGGVKQGIKREGSLLLLAGVVFAVSALLPTLKSRGLWISIPCLFNWVTGLPCLACGLTRSFAMTANGNLARAFEYHLLGPLLFLILCAFVVYLGVSIVTARRVRFKLATRTRRIATYSTLAIFCACWIIKLAAMPKTW